MSDASGSPATQSPAARDTPPTTADAWAAGVPTDLASVWNSTLGVDLMCEANGISREEFLQGKGGDAVELELFLVVVPRVPPLQYFPNVTSLRLMHISLQKIEQLQQLPRLRKLWLSENDITEISGLEELTELEELFLNANSISRIAGLETLGQLRVLWLQQNSIEVVEGLASLSELRSLSLAANRIRTIGDALAPLTKLEELNVSANLLSSFREVLPLAVLPQLEKLWFSDAVYGSNPLCALSNYQTFTLFSLRRLKQLDYQVVSADQRTMAESTFIKKKIYYNMRIKTLKRNARGMMAKAEQYHTAKESEMQLACTMLQRALYEIEAEISQFSKMPKDEHELIERASSSDDAQPEPVIPDKTFVAELRRKRSAIQAALDRRLEACAELRVLLDDAKQRITRHANNSTRRLILELQTGGNVRLEEGKPKDVWYQSCGELLRTRFFPSDFEAFGIRELRVNRVTKVYNRTVRGHFDAALESLVDTSDSAYKRALEYLFVIEYPELLSDEDLFRFIEFGHDTDTAPHRPQKAGAKGRGIAVTNSVFLAEHLRLQSALKRGDVARAASQGGDCPVVAGRIIVAKAFIGKVAPETPTFVPPTSDVPLASEGLAPHEYAPDVTSVFRNKQGDSKQRIWFILDPRLVLPEYVIEYSMLAGGRGSRPGAPIPSASGGQSTSSNGDWVDPSKAADVNELVARAFPAASPVDVTDLRSLAPHFLQYAQHVNAVVAGAGTREEATQATSADPELPRRALDCEDQDAVPVSAVGRYLASRRSQQPQPSTADAADVARATQKLLISLESVFIVGSPMRGLHPDVRTALKSSITRLVLPHNDIPSIDFVVGLDALTALDVSHNVIRKIDPLQGESLPNLTSLRIAGNLLYRVEDAHTLVGCCANLKQLAVLGNPAAESRRFVDVLVVSLTQLDELDARHPSGKTLESWRAALSCRPTTLDIAGARVAVARSTADPMRRRVEIHETSLTPSYESYVPLLEGQDDQPLSKMNVATSSVLVARGQRLTDAPCIAQMPELLVIDLGENCLTCFDSVLPRATTVESLTLDGNRIWRLEDLVEFRALRRLELGRNHLSKVDGLRGLPNLSFLALEDNSISNIAALGSLPALSELYLSNNRLASAKEVLHLRDLPRLIIADLSGNPCCTEDSYRLYAVFQLKKLKVLDGVSIDAAEQIQAKEVYAGRISAELLNERVDPPGVDWSQVTELVLSNCGIKEVTLLDTFVSLQHLVLDRNLLSDLSGLARCSALVSLDVSFNKLGSAPFPIGRLLNELGNLESISLESNGISSIAALQLTLPKLKFLNVKGNELTRVDGLDGVPNLRELVLDRNKLRAFEQSCFAGTPYLRNLSCDENSLKVLDGLRALQYLQRVSFASNRIQEVTDITRALENAKQITEATFMANQAARKQMYRATLVNVFPLLATLDGKDVSPDERERAEGFFQQEAQMAMIPPNVLTDVRPVITATQGVSGVGMQPRAGVGLRVMTLEGEPSPIQPQPQAPQRGRQGAPAAKGPGAARTSSADLSLRPRPKPSTSGILPGVPRRRL